MDYSKWMVCVDNKGIPLKKDKLYLVKFLWGAESTVLVYDGDDNRYICSSHKFNEPHGYQSPLWKVLNGEEI